MLGPIKDDPYVNTSGNMQDFTNPENKVPTVIGISVFLMVLATTTTASRFYTRLRILRMTGLDDWLVLAAWVMIIGHGITQCLMTRVNLGRHIGFMTTPEDFPTFFKVCHTSFYSISSSCLRADPCSTKMFYASLIMYNAALMAIKLAFLAQYYRIMTGGSLRRAVIIISCIVGLWSTLLGHRSQMIIVIFQCQPVSGFWAPTPDTVCVPSVPGLYISAAGNIVSDLAIVALPLPMIRGLHLPLAQRLVLSLVFCLGLVTTAISLLRLKFLKVSPDITWDIADSNLCSLAEISSGITCACLPTLKPLAAQLFPKLFSTLRTQFADMRAPTPEWRPRNLKGMLRDDINGGPSRACRSRTCPWRASSSNHCRSGRRWMRKITTTKSKWRRSSVSLRTQPSGDQ
ncbi:hypothetical protein PG990_013469 [Apiospora arundinis]